MSFRITMEFADKKYGETKYIKKVGNKWRIFSSKDNKMWDAEYDTAEKAHKALMAYHVQQSMSDKKLGATKNIKHIDGKWRIVDPKDNKLWEQPYDTAELAHKALAGYWVQRSKESVKK